MSECGAAQNFGRLPWLAGTWAGADAMNRRLKFARIPNLRKRAEDFSGNQLTSHETTTKKVEI